MNRIKNKMGGRPPKIDPATNRISVNLSDVEYADFLTLYEKSGVHSIGIPNFIRTKGWEIKIS